MSKPNLTMNTAVIPATMKAEPRWCLWKYEGRGSGKRTKVPYQTNGWKAKSNKPNTWCPHADAEEAYEAGGYSGLGFMLGNGWVGVDLDDVIDSEDRLGPAAEEIVRDLNSYAEVSPSGRGIKAIFRAEWPEGQKVQPGKIDGAKTEVYGERRFFTVTGCLYRDAPETVKEAQVVVDRLVDRLGGVRVAPSREVKAWWPDLPDAEDLGSYRKRVEQLAEAIQGERGRISTFAAGCQIRRWELNESDSWDLLQHYNNTRCHPPWDDSSDSGSESLRCKFVDSCRAVVSQLSSAEEEFYPVDDPGEDWLPFPTERLPEPLKSLVTEGAKAIGTDESFIALPGLAIAAGAIGATRTARIKRGWSEPAVVWCVVVSPSGATKSQGRKLIIAPLLKRQQQALRDYESKLREFDALNLAYELELKQWKTAKGSGTPPQAPEKPQLVELFTSDATIEAMVRVLTANPRGVLLEADELAGWVKSFDAYKGGKGADAQHWINLHGAGHIKVNRAGLAAPIFVSRAAVSVSGTIQPAILTAALGGEHTASGFAARLLMAEPPRQQKRWTDHEVREEIETAFADRLGELLDLKFATNDEGEPYPIALPLSVDARERMKRFVNEHGAEGMQRHGAEAAAWSKLEGYAVRLALVLQLIDAPDASEISDHWLDVGIELSRWFGKEAARFYRGVSGNAGAEADRKLAVWIESQGGSVTAREAQQGRRDLTSAVEAMAALERLVARGVAERIEVEPGSSGGRATTRYCLMTTSTSTQPPQTRVLEGSVDVDTSSPLIVRDVPTRPKDGPEAVL